MAISFGKRKVKIKMIEKPVAAEETGYGEGDGLCGWNCYHSFYPYFEGLSTRAFSPDPSADAGRDNDEDYYLQQKQRTYERRIRQSKKECQLLNSAIESTDSEALEKELYADFQRASVLLKNREQRLKDFLAENARIRQNDREWVAGWNRSVSSKAVWANRKATKGS